MRFRANSCRCWQPGKMWSLREGSQSQRAACIVAVFLLSPLSAHCIGPESPTTAQSVILHTTASRGNKSPGHLLNPRPDVRVKGPDNDMPEATITLDNETRRNAYNPPPLVNSIAESDEETILTNGTFTDFQNSPWGIMLQSLTSPMIKAVVSPLNSEDIQNTAVTGSGIYRGNVQQKQSGVHGLILVQKTTEDSFPSGLQGWGSAVLRGRQTHFKPPPDTRRIPRSREFTKMDNSSDNVTGRQASQSGLINARNRKPKLQRTVHQFSEFGMPKSSPPPANRNGSRSVLVKAKSPPSGPAEVDSQNAAKRHSKGQNSRGSPVNNQTRTPVEADKRNVLRDTSEGKLLGIISPNSTRLKPVPDDESTWVRPDGEEPYRSRACRSRDNSVEGSLSFTDVMVITLSVIAIVYPHRHLGCLQHQKSK